MNKLILSASIAALSGSSAMAQEAIDPIEPAPAPAVTVPTVVPAAPATAMGKIIIYRQGAIMGMGLGCPIRYKGVEIVELGRNKYAEWEVPAGSYILANKTSSVDVNVNPGQTKYVRCVIKTGMFLGRADLQIVDAETYGKNSADYERKEVAAPALAAAE